MALINNKYIFVLTESVARGVTTSDHPVEQGISLTDNVRRNPVTISLKAEIVGKHAKKTLDYLYAVMEKGTPVKYQGVNKYSRTMIIESLNVDNDYKIRGGYAADISIREIRVAKSNYYQKGKTSKTNNKSKNGTKQVQQNKKGAVYHTVKRGEYLAMIAPKYKSLGCTVAYLQKNNNNTKVLGRKGDWRTLKVGAKLLVGYRK